MKVAPTFQKAILDSSQDKVNTGHWATVLDSYEKGNYKDAVIGLLDYVDSSLVSRTGNAAKTEFSIPHGSVIVNLQIDDNILSVSAPFLKIPAQNIIPLLRQVAQINFSPLCLATIILEGEILTFKYSCPLELCEPYKIYDIFREICIYSDTYDDYFIKKFKAIRIIEPKVQYYSKEKTDEVWDTVQLYVKEALIYIDRFMSQRWYNYVWDIVVQTLMKIEYYVGPQGFLRTEIERTISYMENKDIELNERISEGEKFLLKLQRYNRNEFDKDIYIVDTFIPYKYSKSFDQMKDDFENWRKTAEKEMNSNNYLGATFTFQYIFLYNFFHYNLPAEVSSKLTDALLKSSGKPWKEAAETLRKAMNDILSGNLKVKSKHGFFRKLFR